MASQRAGARPTDTPAAGKDRPTPWKEFHRVIDQMFDLMEGVHKDDGASASPAAARRKPVAGGG
ncbi:hypothetical protein [Streptomyces sp. NPDC031705]|uniref:hypothetical protein n=1 Tax=Streptomyces sp. NPDC031705 TaxID=3155729 RepID=UPI0033D28A73